MRIQNIRWYKNVAAKGGCSIYWKKRDYQMVHPHFVDKEVGLLAFPKVVQAALRTAGIEYFLRLETA